MPYKGIIPLTGTDVTNKFEIHIWSWRPSRRSMTHGKKIPGTSRTKYGPPLRWIHHIPRLERMITQKGGCHPYWCVFTNHSPTPDLTSQKLKIWKKYIISTRWLTFTPIEAYVPTNEKKIEIDQSNLDTIYMSNFLDTIVIFSRTFKTFNLIHNTSIQNNDIISTGA